MHINIKCILYKGYISKLLQAWQKLVHTSLRWDKTGKAMVRSWRTIHTILGPCLDSIAHASPTWNFWLVVVQQISSRLNLRKIINSYLLTNWYKNQNRSKDNSRNLTSEEVRISIDKQLNYWMTTEQSKAWGSVVTVFEDKFNCFKDDNPNFISRLNVSDVFLRLCYWSL